MSSDAAHHVGSQVVTVSGLVHPRPTVYMGWDKRSVFLSIEGKEVLADVLSGMEESLPLVEHLDDHLATHKVSSDKGQSACLNAS